MVDANQTIGPVGADRTTSSVANKVDSVCDLSEKVMRIPDALSQSPV